MFYKKFMILTVLCTFWLAGCHFHQVKSEAHYVNLLTNKINTFTGFGKSKVEADKDALNKCNKSKNEESKGNVLGSILSGKCRISK